MPYADCWVAFGDRRLGALVEPLDDAETRWRWTAWAWDHRSSTHVSGDTDSQVAALEAVSHFFDALPG